MKGLLFPPQAPTPMGLQVYDAASDPDGDPDTDPFDERDRAGLAVERYMLRKALRCDHM